MNEDLQHEYHIRTNDLIYFETNVPIGKHLIEVNYTAERWKNSKGLVKKYDFSYVLAPAKYWKSYGSLDVTIISRNFLNPIKTNLPDKENDIITFDLKGSFDKDFNYTIAFYDNSKGAFFEEQSLLSINRKTKDKQIRYRTDLNLSPGLYYYIIIESEGTLLFVGKFIVPINE